MYTYLLGTKSNDYTQTQWSLTVPLISQRNVFAKEPKPNNTKVQY